MKRLFGSSLSAWRLPFFLLCLAVWCGPAIGPGTIAAEKTLLTGKVSDAAGLPVEGAMVFVYSNPSVRRSADYMSPPTDSDGVYRVFLPAGRYWAVARLKKTEGVGPLMPGDRHSGDPAEVDLSLAREADVDFTVTDLREAIRLREKPRDGAVKITGRIVDEKGAPVAGVYAVADRRAKAPGIPEYLSAWVGEDGGYTLYVPKGSYYLGSSSAFPPGKTCLMNGEIKVDGDRSGVDIVRNSTKKE